MKVEVNVAKFAAAYGTVAAIAPTRSPKEVLQNVKLVVDENELVLQATDMEFAARVALDDGYSVLTTGTVLLPVRWVSNVLRETTDELLTLECEDSVLHLTGLNSSFKLPTMNPDEFPNVERFDAEAFHRAEARSFAAAIKRTVFAADVETSRYALGGIKLEMTEDTALVVGTDGRRLAKAEFQARSVGDHSTDREASVIIPARAAHMIERCVSGSDAEEVDIECRSNDVRVRVDGTEFYSRLVEGRYPNWRQVIPEGDDGGSVRVSAGSLARLIRQAAITTDRESRGIDFIFSDGELRLESRTADIGESKVSMPASLEGDAQTSTLDNAYVADFCKVIDGEEDVYFGLNNNGPAKLITEDDFIYIVMPMARDK